MRRVDRDIEHLIIRGRDGEGDPVFVGVVEQGIGKALGGRLPGDPAVGRSHDPGKALGTETEAPQRRPQPVRVARRPQDLGDAVEIGMVEQETPTRAAVGGGEEPRFSGGENAVLIPRVHRESEELFGHDLFGLGQKPGLATVVRSKQSDAGNKEAPDPGLAAADVDHLRVRRRDRPGRRPRDRSDHR